MKRALTLAACAALAMTLGLAPVQAKTLAEAPNAVAGTWRMISATLEEGGGISHPYGMHPVGMLVFTTDMHFVEVLTDPTIPRFASDRRGDGADEENRRAMAGAIGFFGAYTVDRQGRFSGNRVEGATFPNWVGSVRTPRELQLIVDGDRMVETFSRPGGGIVRAEFRRAR